MSELKKYSKELLASKIGAYIHSEGCDSFTGEIEFEECTAEVKGIACWNYPNEEWEFHKVELSDVQLQFENSETNFKVDELEEMDILVKMYYP